MGERYIYRRGKRYYFRKRVPSDLRYLFSGDYVHRALFTAIHGDALQRATYFLLQFERVFTILRSSYLSILEKNLILKRLLEENPYSEPYEQGINFVFRNQGKCLEYYESEKSRGINMVQDRMEYKQVLSKAVDDLWAFFSAEWEFLPVKAKDSFIEELSKNPAFSNVVTEISCDHFGTFVDIGRESLPDLLKEERFIAAIGERLELSGTGVRSRIVETTINAVLAQNEGDAAGFSMSRDLLEALYPVFRHDVDKVFDDIIGHYLKVMWISLFTEKSMDYLANKDDVSLQGMIEVLQSATAFGFGKEYNRVLREYTLINFPVVMDFASREIQGRVSSLANEGVKKALSLLLKSSSREPIVFMSRDAAPANIEQLAENRKRLITAQIEVDASMVANVYSILNEALARCSSIHIEKTGEIPSYTIGNDKFVSAVSREKKQSATSLEAIISKFITEQVSKKKWSPKLQIEIPPMMEVLVELLEGVDYQTLTEEEASEIVFMPLQKIPAYRKRKSKYKGKSIKEVLAMRNDINRQVMSVPTINKYMYWYTALFDFAKKHKYIKDNPFSDLSIQDDRSPEEEKDAFSTEDLVRLFTCPLYNKKDFPKEFDKFHRSGKNRFWVAIIGLFTGMRLSEICSLRVTDFIIDMGVNCIMVNKRQSGKRVKSRAGYRLIPIHPSLIEIGLLVFVENLRTQGESRLFPELPESKVVGSGHHYTNFFSRVSDKYLKPYFTEGDKKSFHSFRHTFSTALKYGGADILMIDEVTGHTGPLRTESKRYSKQYTTEIKFEAVKNLRLEIDVAGILREQGVLEGCFREETEGSALAAPQVESEGD